MLAIHPGLIHAPFQAWAMLSRQLEESGLNELGSSTDETTGFFGYRITAIKRATERTANITFEGPTGMPSVTHTVSAGPRRLRPISHIRNNADVYVTERFIGLLTSFFQVHALNRDISIIPPALPSSASSSTNILVKLFHELLGYETEAIHMYKEISGRELIMRRKVDHGGATSWVPRYDSY